ADDSAASHDDEPRHDGAVFRRSRSARRRAGWRGRQGIPLSARWAECRAHSDCRRVRRRRTLVRGARDRICEPACRVQPADRPEPGRPVSDCTRPRQCRSGGSDALSCGRSLRSRRTVRGRGEHGETAGGRRVVGSRQCCGADARRLRVCRGLRRGTKIPRDAAVPSRADLDEPDPRVCRRARARVAAIVLMDRPLAHTTVIALEQAVAAPLATRHLADLGARVIKIERPDGGDFARSYDTTVRGMSSYFVWLNRSKESLTLDLKRPEGAQVLARLLDRADVFVQNLAPGAADRLGTGAGHLRARYPKLIVW